MENLEKRFKQLSELKNADLVEIILKYENKINVLKDENKKLNYKLFSMHVKLGEIKKILND